jgi:two-component system chemotaxis response regulator CheB
MVVDDSAVARAYLTGELSQAGCQVVAAAANPMEAWPLLPLLRPDVVVLDVDMPGMDGLSFLRQIMSHQPLPVVMCSTLTQAGRSVAVQALRLGAVAVVAKPGAGGEIRPAEEVAHELVSAVRSAALARVSPHRPSPRAPGACAVPAAASPATATAPVSGGPPLAPGAGDLGLAQRVLALGLSTGGVAALGRVLHGLSGPLPGILVVQHMPAAFTASLAQQLDRELPHLTVTEARHGDAVTPGRVCIAPGGRHMRLAGSPLQGWRVALDDEAPVRFHRPSVDVLFHSLARLAGPLACGVLMTGMGEDGAQGLLAMRQAGARTAAQDEASCAVFGMPAAAIRLGAAQAVLPLDDVAPWLMGAGRGGAESGSA